MTKVASQIGVESRSVFGYERGEYSPDDDKVDALACALGFPREFFFGPDPDVPTPDTASFRALKRMSAAQRDSALGLGALAFMLNEWIEQRFQVPSVELPDLNVERDPEAAAESLRRQWGLGELPIKNVVHLLESKGVRVFSMAIDAAEVDAFSMWRQGTPYVFLNTRKSAEHSRFDGSHELGHLVLHRHGNPRGQGVERDANQFASAFLMPRATVLALSPRFVTVDRLIELKKYWNVSVAALAYRMNSLGILSEWHYRNVAIEIAKRGFRKVEPEPSTRETSQVFAKVAAALREDGFSKSDIASDLSIPVQELEQLVFGLVLTGLTSTRSSPGTGRRSKPRLYAVK